MSSNLDKLLESLRQAREDLVKLKAHWLQRAERETADKEKQVRALERQVADGRRKVDKRKGKEEPSIPPWL